MQSTNGNIYGVTAWGGQFGQGTIFCVSTNGNFQTIFAFDGISETPPTTGLVEGDDGWLYGMSDGIYDGTGRGNIFRVSMNGDFDVVASFNGTNGRYPKGSLVKDADGQLYGLAQMGGVFDGGTAFRLTTNHEIKVLASFNQDTGQWPTELTRGADGNFYGTTSVSGGEYIDGTVFRLVQVPEISPVSVSNGAAHLDWTAFASGVYQVEYKASLSDTNWNLLSGRITATTNSTAFTDLSATDASRFYRIGLLPW